MRRLVNIGGINTVQQLAKSVQDEFGYVEKSVIGTTTVRSTANSHPPTSSTVTVSGSGSKTTRVYQQNLTGTMDGSNVSFRIPNSIVVNSERIYWNGQALKRGTGYIILGSSVTLTTAPSSGDSLDADYTQA